MHDSIAASGVRKPHISAVPRVTAKDRKTKSPRFPLWIHASGQWACKRRGRYYYFGTDKDQALKRWTHAKDDIEAGRPIRPEWQQSSKLTIAELFNHFLSAKEAAAESGEISKRTFAEYHDTCRLLIEHFGKSIAVEEIAPPDLLAVKAKWSKQWGVHRLGNHIARARVAFNFGYQNGLLDKPVRFGDFKRPAKVAYRRRRKEAGSKMFEADELRKVLEACDVQMKAMVLLGINCGFGNHDCASLPIAAIRGAWIDHERPKTGIPRRVPLWHETAEALNAVLSQRKQPKNPKDAGLLFVTKYGSAWCQAESTSRQSPLSAEFRKLLTELKLYRVGRSFYSLRHTFQTVAEETGDNTAIRRVMGHADQSMSDVYRERFPDERLRRVVEHVRAWLFETDDGGSQQ